MSEKESPPANREASPPARPFTILLIDDQPIVAAAVRRMLASEADMQVQYCQDPAQALPTAAAIMPQVILLDLVMPGINGLDLLLSFRKHLATSNIPIVVLSAKEDPKIKAEALDRGADDYMVKLPNQVELIARIRHHTRNTERITQQVRQQMRQQIQQVLEEFQYNLRALQEAGSGQGAFVFRDEAWRSLTQQLNLPGDLHNQVETAYTQMRRAHELQQKQAHSSNVKTSSEVKTVLETVKELAPLLVRGLALLI